MGLPYGEEIMIVGRTMWTQCTSVTDGQTDGRTELRSQRPCNGASHSKNREHRNHAQNDVDIAVRPYVEPNPYR